MSHREAVLNAGGAGRENSLGIERTHSSQAVQERKHQRSQGGAAEGHTQPALAPRTDAKQSTGQASSGEAGDSEVLRSQKH